MQGWRWKALAKKGFSWCWLASLAPGAHLPCIFGLRFNQVTPRQPLGVEGIVKDCCLKP